MKILFIQTGGTIDKDYPHTTKGWAFEISEPAVKRILEKLNPSFEYEILSGCKKDSLEIDDEDRARVIRLIEDNPADAYIITHGTDTMLESANYINNKVGDKKIVLTGAMLPERFANSDAPMNLGLALGCVDYIENGVYVAMHGIVRNHKLMKRNLEAGKFY